MMSALVVLSLAFGCFAQHHLHISETYTMTAHFERIRNKTRTTGEEIEWRDQHDEATHYYIREREVGHNETRLDLVTLYHVKIPAEFEIRDHEPCKFHPLPSHVMPLRWEWLRDAKPVANGTYKGHPCVWYGIRYNETNNTRAVCMNEETHPGMPLLYRHHLQYEDEVILREYDSWNTSAPNRSHFAIPESCLPNKTAVAAPRISETYTMTAHFERVRNGTRTTGEEIEWRDERDEANHYLIKEREAGKKDEVRDIVTLFRERVPTEYESDNEGPCKKTNLTSHFMPRRWEWLREANQSKVNGTWKGHPCVWWVVVYPESNNTRAVCMNEKEMPGMPLLYRHHLHGYEIVEREYDSWNASRPNRSHFELPKSCRQHN